MKVKNIMLTALSAIVLLALASCSGVDLSGVESRLDNLESRTSKLETAINSVNDNIARIGKLLDKMSTDVSITKVTCDKSFVRLEFSDGQSITIETGADGDKAPVVGVKSYNGRYFWTLTFNGITSWLRDDDGNMMPVNGRDGTDGRDGRDAPQGEDIIIQPVVSVDEDGYWTISYDNGETFIRLKNHSGMDMTAIPAGNSSEAGVHLFSAFTEKDDSVELTLLNGEILVFEKFVDITIKFEKTEDIDFIDDKTEVGFVVYGDTKDIQLISLDKGSVKSEIVMTSANTGILKVTRFGQWQYSSRVIVMLITPDHTITTLITFYATDKRIDEILTLDVTETFEVDYMEINRGFNPPLVSGTYLAQPFTCVYSSYTDKNFHNATGETFTPRIFRFTEQSADGEIKVDFMDSDRTHHLGEEVFNICGSGKKFTAYAIVERKDTLAIDDIITKRSVYLISGQKEASAIKNFRFAEYIISKSFDATSYYLPEGTYITYKVSQVYETEWPEKE